MIGPGLIGITARLVPICERETIPTTGVAVTLAGGSAVITWAGHLHLRASNPADYERL